MNESSLESLSLLDKRYRTVGFIYGAQIATTVILIVVGYLTVKNADTAVDPNSIMILWAAVLFVAVGAFLLRRKLYRWERLKDLTLTKGISGLLAALQTNTIVLGALAEAIAAVGFVIALMNGNPADLLRAGAVSLIVFLVNFPRKAVWEKIVTNLAKV